MLYTFYGDDFTGSTDVLEQLGSNGVPAVLFLAPPTAAQLATFPGVQAIGIAGDSRSRSPEWMSANLPPIFHILKQFGAPVVHYKVCSTFDSSPHTGSIGRALEIGLAELHPTFVPIVVGAPHLRRFVVFGHLFASAPDGEVYRIDRHPMAYHPVTPMRESDLRLHLGAQTKLAIGLVDLAALGNEAVTVLGATLAASVAAQPVILFDTMDLATQATLGSLLWREAVRAKERNRAVFSASSSGLTAALISAWRSAGLIPAEPPKAPQIATASPLLVVSGSCSLATARQIRRALAHGFSGISLEDEPFDSQAVLEAAVASLAAGRDTILYTALGPPVRPSQLCTAADGEEHPGVALGRLLRRILDLTETTTPVRRVLLCGGDTSSHAVQQLRRTALTWLGNLQPGAPLCLAHGPAGAPRLELVLKGGQVGTDDFFQVVRGASAQ